MGPLLVVNASSQPLPLILTNVAVAGTAVRGRVHVEWVQSTG
ncbi:Hypothetical protein ABZS17I87_01950 [Kosakonia cowanii]